MLAVVRTCRMVSFKASLQNREISGNTGDFVKYKWQVRIRSMSSRKGKVILWLSFSVTVTAQIAWTMRTLKDTSVFVMLSDKEWEQSQETLWLCISYFEMFLTCLYLYFLGVKESLKDGKTAQWVETCFQRTLYIGLTWRRRRGSHLNRRQEWHLLSQNPTTPHTVTTRQYGSPVPSKWPKWLFQRWLTLIIQVSLGLGI